MSQFGLNLQINRANPNPPSYSTPANGSYQNQSGGGAMALQPAGGMPVSRRPVDPNHLALDYLIPAQYAGIVIGRGGSSVKALR